MRLSESTSGKRRRAFGPWRALLLGGLWISAGAATAPALGQETGAVAPGVGARVVARSGDVPIKVEDRVVATSRVHRIYTVQQANGPWLWVVADDGTRGWVQAENVVPLDRAVAYHSGLIESQPDDPKRYLLRGFIWQDLGDPDRAIADFTRAIELKPDYASAYNSRGNAWRLKGELDRAIADFDRAIGLDPDYGALFYNRGMAYYEKGDYPKAIDDFTAAIRIDPNSPTAFINRARAFRARGGEEPPVTDLDRAIADLSEAIRLAHIDAQRQARGGATNADPTEAIRLAPQYATEFLARGDAWLLKEEFELALSDMTRAIELDPGYARAYLRRGVVLRTMDPPDFDGALDDFNKAIELEPDNATAYMNRGIVRQETRDFNGARADYARAIELAPRDPWAYNNLSWLQATCPDDRFRDAEKALTNATKACELTKWKDPYCLGSLAAASAEAGKFPDAIKWQQEALKFFPTDDPELLDHRLRLEQYQADKPYRTIMPEETKPEETTTPAEGEEPSEAPAASGTTAAPSRTSS